MPRKKSTKKSKVDQWVELGDRVKDKITGVTGIAVGSTLWLNGCVRYAIQPEKLHEGKALDYHWCDEQQTVVVKKRVVDLGGIPKGGPQKDPKRRTGG